MDQENIITAQIDNEFILEKRPSKILFQSKWKSNAKSPPDQDILVMNCLMFNNQLALSEAAFFNHIRADNQAVRYLHPKHSHVPILGYNEAVDVNLLKLDMKYKVLAFVLSANTGFTLSNIADLSMGVSDITNGLEYVVDMNYTNVEYPKEKLLLLAIMFRSDVDKSEDWKMIPLNQPIPNVPDFVQAVPFIHDIFVRYKVTSDRRLIEEMKRIGCTRTFDIDKGESILLGDEVRTIAATVSHKGCAVAACFFSADNSLVPDDDQRNMVGYSRDTNKEAVTGHIHLSTVRRMKEVSYAIVIMRNGSNEAKEDISLTLYNQSKALEIKKYSFTPKAIKKEKYLTVCKIIKLKSGWKVVSMFEEDQSRSRELFLTETAKSLEKQLLLTVTIGIREARNLPAMDLNGFSDPYYKVYLDGELSYQSEIVKKTLNPKWEGEITHQSKGTNIRKVYTLRIEVWDWDRIGSDDFIGDVAIEVDMSKKKRIQVKNKWFKLMRKNSKENGEILCDLMFSIDGFEEDKWLKNQIQLQKQKERMAAQQLQLQQENPTDINDKQ